MAGLKNSNSGIEVEVELLDDMKKFYGQIPNALLRGERQPELGLDFRGYTLRARCLLAALYSMESGYRCSRERLDKLAPELGESAMDTVVKELKSKGNLITRRMNDPKNRGKFIWRWQVRLRTAGVPAQRSDDDESPGQTGSAGVSEQESPGQTRFDAPEGGEAGSVGDIIPAQTMGRLSRDGQSMPGSSTPGRSTPGSSGSLSVEDQPLPTEQKKIFEETKKSKTPPLPPVLSSTAAVPAQLEQREGDSSSPNTNPMEPGSEPWIRALVADLVATSEAAGLRWGHCDQRLRSALRDRAVSRREPELVRAGLLELASGMHGQTVSPKLILDMVDSWWNGVDDRRRGRAVQGGTVPGQRAKAKKPECNLCDDDGMLLDASRRPDLDPARAYDDRGFPIPCAHKAMAGVS